MRETQLELIQKLQRSWKIGLGKKVPGWVLKEILRVVIMILLVEANKITAKILRRYLESEGREVDLCADGRTAQRQLESEKRYDLIILDQILPWISGLELVRRARAIDHHRDTPIIMFSAAECEAEALAAGANSYVGKLGKGAELFDAINRFTVSDDRRGGN